MPGSSRRFRLAVGALTLAAAACSGRNIVAVDPYPCAEAGAVGCTPGLLDKLIGWWRLNDPSGSATARDWSGWANTGTLMGIDPATAWSAGGPEGGNLAVSGSGYINVPRSASIDSVTDQVTVAAWIYIDGTITEYATAISRQVGTGYGQHYHLSINAHLQPALFLELTMAGQVVIFGEDRDGRPITVPEQTWVHIAATYDGSQARLYLNGAEIGSKAATGSFAAETNPLILAGNGNGAARAISEAVPGRLNEIMLYRRALGPDEIARLRSGALLPATDAGADASSQ